MVSWKTSDKSLTKKKTLPDGLVQSSTSQAIRVFGSPASSSDRNRPKRDLRSDRIGQGILPTYRLVDTCAAEFEAYTPYYYSTYGDEDETAMATERKS